MSNVSNVIFTVLFIANLFATGYSCIAVDDIFDDEVDLCSDDAIPVLYAGIYSLTLLLTLKLTEYNINLALLVQVIAIIANILVASLAIRIDYKRNVQPYLQIKI